MSVREPAVVGRTRQHTQMAVAIAALALVVTAAEQVDAAVRLAGGTQALLERACCDLPGFLRRLYEQTLGTLRERVGACTFDRYFAAGHALAAAELVTEALGSSEPSAASAEPGDASPEYIPLSAGMGGGATGRPCN